MQLSRGSKIITITIEDMWDWTDLFDNKEDEFKFKLDADNLDIFVPGWDNYIDSENPFNSLRKEDIDKIQSILILLASDVQNFGGEGMYEVVKRDCVLANSNLEESPSFEEFLEFTGTVSFKVIPNHPVP